jgi:hypothetical protein
MSSNSKNRHQLDLFKVDVDKMHLKFMKYENNNKIEGNDTKLEGFNIECSSYRQ